MGRIISIVIGFLLVVVGLTEAATPTYKIGDVVDIVGILSWDGQYIKEDKKRGDISETVQWVAVETPCFNVTPPVEDGDYWRFIKPCDERDDGKFSSSLVGYAAEIDIRDRHGNFTEWMQKFKIKEMVGKRVRVSARVSSGRKLNILGSEFLYYLELLKVELLENK